MCDTLWMKVDGGAIFAKNSDRPVSEVQVVEHHGRRAPGGRLRTQYLEIDDTGAYASVLSRPMWLWGAEHGVNEYGVAIGNEMVNTIDDAAAAPEGLIGMDLVRLGLERGRDAVKALEVIIDLLERHGQGGVADNVNEFAYFSSFLVADPDCAWVLETSGRTWAARPIVEGAAISNRLTLRHNWTRASTDVPAGADFDTWRDPNVGTGFADGRLAASQRLVNLACVATSGNGAVDAKPVGVPDVVAHLRDHGTGPWGAPGGASEVLAPPAQVLPDGTGVTVCMHIPGFESTTASMVAMLGAPVDGVADAGGNRLRAWFALGSPCASLYVPALVPTHVPGVLADPELWRRFASLRDVVEADPGALRPVRAELGMLEEELWSEADALDDDDTSGWERFDAAMGTRISAVLARLDRDGAAGGAKTDL